MARSTSPVPEPAVPRLNSQVRRLSRGEELYAVSSAGIPPPVQRAGSQRNAVQLGCNTRAFLVSSERATQFKASPPRALKLNFK
eukprot:scaffold62949_cov66-Phaeocystis_antarctica.AAC.5